MKSPYRKLCELTAVICGVWFASFYCSAADKLKIDPDQGELANIHAGAVWKTASGGTAVILVETYNGRFFFGNSWGNKWKLSSNWCRAGGGEPAEVLAYLRGEGYKYAGRAE